MCIKKLINNSVDLVKEMNMLDITIFKLTVFAAGLWIAKLFPVVISLNIWIYVAVWAL